MLLLGCVSWAVTHSLRASSQKEVLQRVCLELLHENGGGTTFQVMTAKEQSIAWLPELDLMVSDKEPGDVNARK